MNLQELSLLPNGTQAIREKLDIYSAEEFVHYVAIEKHISIDEARAVIRNNPKLLAIMFAIA